MSLSTGSHDRDGPRQLALGRRALWSIVGQGLSAATNTALTIAAARSSSAHEFGAIALVLVGYRLAISVGRALAGEPLIVRFATSDRETWLAGVGGALGLQLIIAGTASALLAVVGVIGGQTTRPAFLALAVVLPLTLAQDLLRYALLAAGRPDQSAMNDLVWAVALAAGFAVALAVADPPAPVLVLIWGSTAGVAAVVMAMRHHFRPVVAEGIRWFRRERAISLRFGAEYVVLTGAIAFAFVIVGLISGLEASGALRAAETVLGPATIVIYGLRGLGIQEGAVLAGAQASILRPMLRLSAVATTTTALVVAAALLLPHRWGTALFGESWEGANAVLPWVGVYVLAWAAASGPLSGLRGLAQADRSLRVRLMQAPVLIGGAAVGAFVWDARGAAIGLSAGSWIAVLLATHHVLAATRSQGRRVMDSAASIPEALS